VITPEPAVDPDPPVSLGFDVLVVFVGAGDGRLLGLVEVRLGRGALVAVGEGRLLGLAPRLAVADGAGTVTDGAASGSCSLSTTVSAGAPSEAVAARLESRSPEGDCAEAIPA
jgi:hypothetical protein